MYGVADGLYECNHQRTDELNERISLRNIPSSSLQPQFGIRPVSTKYAIMPIVDRRSVPKVEISRAPLYKHINYI